MDFLHVPKFHSIFSKQRPGNNYDSGKGKCRYILPLVFLFLVPLQFTWISQDFPLNFMSFHNNVVYKSTFVIVLFNNSPILKDPKNAKQLTVQNICLLSADQFVCAISFPRIFKRGSVMIFLLRILLGSYTDIFSAPRSIIFTVKL